MASNLLSQTVSGSLRVSRTVVRMVSLNRSIAFA